MIVTEKNDDNSVKAQTRSYVVRVWMEAVRNKTACHAG